MPSKINEDDTLQRLVDMTNQTCLVALDKTLAAIKNAKITGGYAVASQRANSIAERMIRASQEVKMILPRK